MIGLLQYYKQQDFALLYVIGAVMGPPTTGQMIEVNRLNNIEVTEL